MSEITPHRLGRAFVIASISSLLILDIGLKLLLDLFAAEVVAEFDDVDRFNRRSATLMPGVMHSLRGLFSGGPYYVRLGRTRLSMRDVASGATFETGERIGLDAENRILEVGDMQGSVARVIEPFNHPRVAMADLMIASKLLQYGMQQLWRAKWISPAPIVVIQPDSELDGGLSELETRALVELGQSAGARKTLVHYGSVLSDADVVRLANG